MDRFDEQAADSFPVPRTGVDPRVRCLRVTVSAHARACSSLSGRESCRAVSTSRTQSATCAGGQASSDSALAPTAASVDLSIDCALAARRSAHESSRCRGGVSPGIGKHHRLGELR